jgi:outer membrane murein-binding lipoprotein Lpp
MKKLLIAAAALGTLGIAACGGEDKTDDAADKGADDKTEKTE